LSDLRETARLILGASHHVPGPNRDGRRPDRGELGILEEDAPDATCRVAERGQLEVSIGNDALIGRHRVLLLGYSYVGGQRARLLSTYQLTRRVSVGSLSVVSRLPYPPRQELSESVASMINLTKTKGQPNLCAREEDTNEAGERATERRRPVDTVAAAYVVVVNWRGEDMARKESPVDS